jgi:hypothetical protein
MNTEEVILVSAPTKAGEAFMQTLKHRDISFAAMTNSEVEKARLNKIGISQVIVVDTKNHCTWGLPNLPVGRIYLFEHSLALCCRYIQICRSWTSKPIYVVTSGNNSRMIYRGLGANYVIHTQGRDVSYLIEEEEEIHSK